MALHSHQHEQTRDQLHVHEHCLKMTRRPDGTPWWADYPEPRSAPRHVDGKYVHKLLHDQECLAEHEPRRFLLVDARRTDCTGGTIRGALNLPAHSFYPTRAALYELCKQAGIKKVIFYCGSSLGRGPRCAAWLQDYVNDIGGGLESLVMVGGIRGWVEAYGGGMMDGYDEKARKAEDR